MTDADAPSPQFGFAPTRWTQVLCARGNSPEGRQALADLCECYWTPVFRFLRSHGKDEDTARELTQEFFTRLLARPSLDGASPERGRFRSYLLGAVKHFLADVRDHDLRLKRGGGVMAESLDATSPAGTSPALQVPDPAATAPDTAFDRAWALAVMGRALAALQRECQMAGKETHFETLKPWLAGETPALSQAEAAARLQMNEGALKVAIHRLRKRFRDMVRDELAQTVDGAADVDAELRYLVAALCR